MPIGVAACPATGSGLPAHGGGTPAVHPGRGPRCARVILRPASARGPHRSALRLRWSGEGRARASGDHRRTVAGEAGDAVDTRGLNGLGERHRRQNRGEPPGQHRRARQVITSHRRHCHSLRASALHGPLQGNELKAPRWTDRGQCRLTHIRPVRPKRPACSISTTLMRCSRSASYLSPPDHLCLSPLLRTSSLFLRSRRPPVLFHIPPDLVVDQ
jgi:hypothetical protein